MAASVRAAAFEALPVEAAVVDGDGRIVQTNRAWRAFGRENDAPNEAWVGENYLSVCDGSDEPLAAEVADGLRAVLAGERERYEREYPCSSPSEERWFLMVAERFEHDGGAHLLVLHVDVTERKLAERAVAAANERLETLTDVLTHDLRNPLGVALGYVDLLAEEVDRDELDRVSTALDRMERLIEDALTLARGRSGLEPAVVDLEDRAREAWATVLTGEATLVVEDTCAFEADPGLLGNLLENLFRNAVEHAGEGPTVTVTALADGFAVADDGPGIPPDRREAVFEAGETTAGGTGLGLAIVRRVADAHGWTVAVDVAATGGARFEVRGVEVLW